jgi:hypothetical protein
MFRSRVGVSVASMSTLLTLEFGLRFTISFSDMPTLRTLTRSITRVNGNHPDACQARLVFNKHSQLPERPAMQFCVPLASSPNPLANPGQVFQDYRLL